MNRKLEEIYNEIKENLIENKKTNNTPKALILGGQPGSGKSSIIKKFDTEPYIFIESDAFRKHFNNPTFDPEQTFTNNPEKFIELSGQLSGEITNRLIEELSDEKYNLIIEGTFRTSEVPIRTATTLVNKGYSCEALLMATKPDISYLSTTKRYLTLEIKKSNDENTLARPVTRKHHDITVKSIGQNIQTVQDSKLFDAIHIYNRKELLYSFPKEDTRKVSKIFNALCREPLSAAEKMDYQKDLSSCKEMLKELKNKKITPFISYKKIEEKIKDSESILSKGLSR